jgi:HlyD family secretion protein
MLKHAGDRLEEFRARTKLLRGWLSSNAPSATVDDDAIPFQNVIDEIVEEKPAPFFRGAHYSVVVMFLVALIVAALVRTDIVVSSRGRLTTDVPPILLQPIERAIVREILVKPGDKVSKGQVLAILDPTFSKADVEALTVQQRALVVQARRIEAELAGKPFAPSPSHTPDEAIQASLYAQRMAQYQSQLRIYDQDIARLQADIKNTQTTLGFIAQQFGNAKEVEHMRQTLMTREFGSRLTYLDSQNMRVRLEREQQETSGRLVELQHGLQSKQAERQNFLDRWRGELLEKLVNVRTEAAKIGENLSKATLINDLVVITAPKDGVVLNVAKRSGGSVLREAEPLFTIIPVDASLVAEVSIPSSDVGYVKPGAHVVLKIDTYPYSRHGFLEGELESVSEDSEGSSDIDMTAPFKGKQGSGAVHRGRVKLLTTKLDRMPDGIGLIPGMTLTAEISIGSRSVLGFFVEPLARGFRESLREP